MTGPDEKWYRDGEGYWRPSTVGEDRWLVIVGEPPQPAQDAPGRPKPPSVAAVAAPEPDPEPDPIPVTRAQRLRNLMEAVRSGDRSAVDLLRQAIGANDDDAA